MGHRIAVLDAGVLQQVGAPQDVYARPANLFVARFIGSPPMNTVAGTRRPRRRRAGRARSRAATSRSSRSWRRRGRGRGRRRGRDRRAARGPALRRHRRHPGVGERGRVARARAPRRVPPRRPAARDRAPGRPRGGAGRGERARSSSPTPTALHVFDPRSGARIGAVSVSEAAVASRPARRRRPSSRAGAGLPAADPVAADLRRVRVLAARAQRVPRLLPQPAVPGSAEHLRRVRPVPRRPHVGDVRRQREDHVPVRVPHRARRHRARARPRRSSRTSSCAASASTAPSSRRRWRRRSRWRR